MDHRAEARRALDEIIERWQLPVTGRQATTLPATLSDSIVVTDFKIRVPGANGPVEFEGDAENPRDREFAKELLARSSPTEVPGGAIVSAVMQSGHVGVLLSIAVDEYVSERSKSWAPATQKEFPQFLRTFIEIVGDGPVAMMDKKTFERFRKELQLLPPNRRKDKFFRSMSLAQIIAHQQQVAPDKRRTMTAKTVDSYISAAHTFLSWCEDRGYLEKNPASGGTVLRGAHKRKNAGKTRLGFEPDELAKIFDPERIATFTRPDRFWIPLISLLTGARLNEIAQLEVGDISVIDTTEDDTSELWGILIRNGKTAASRRRVPIHRILLDIGLLEYVRQVAARGHKQLFPNLNKGAKGYGRAVSRWFGHYLDELGITAREKVFHSFRHTMATLLERKGIGRPDTMRLIGHEDGSVTTSYVDDYSTRDLYRNVFAKIAFPSIKFSAIKYDWERFEKVLK